MNPPPTDPAYRAEEDPRDRGRPPQGVAAGVAGNESGHKEADHDLLRRMAAGEEGALGALYDRWAPLVHSVVMHILKDAHEAEETVEAAFWQAWRQASRYDVSRGTVSTWLTTIARSRALDRIRARNRIREESWSRFDPRQISALADAPAPGHDPLAGAESAERREIVIAAIQTLPQEQRETIEMAYFGGLSQSEIAARMGQPLGTVKTRARLAFEKLRERLQALQEETR